MTFDATFWVAVSFVIFFVTLIYLEVPKKINETLNKLIKDIKNEIEESENLRRETKSLLDKAQLKLDTASVETKKILDQAKKDADTISHEMNEKFNKSVEIKRKVTEEKIRQMKEQAFNDMKNASVKIAIDSAKKIIATSVDKSKLDTLFQKNLDETKEELKKINS